MPEGMEQHYKHVKRAVESILKKKGKKKAKTKKRMKGPPTRIAGMRFQRLGKNPGLKGAKKKKHHKMKPISLRK